MFLIPGFIKTDINMNTVYYTDSDKQFFIMFFFFNSLLELDGTLLVSIILHDFCNLFADILFLHSKMFDDPLKSHFIKIQYNKLTLINQYQFVILTFSAFKHSREICEIDQTINVCFRDSS